jgi:hypothetical protein
LASSSVERRRLAGGIHLKLVDHGAELVLEVLRHAAVGAGFPRPGDGVHVTVEVVQGGQGFVERGNGALGAADFAADTGSVETPAGEDRRRRFKGLL